MWCECDLNLDLGLWPSSLRKKKKTGASSFEDLDIKCTSSFEDLDIWPLVYK